MALHVIYESSAGTTIDWTTTDHVRLPEFEITENAEEGTVAQSTLLVEDEGGALNIVGQKRWWAYETAAPAGDQIIACGFVGDREIGRDAGGPEPFMVGADRRWSVGLVDKEQVLSDRVLTGPTAERPAETDIARLTWLLGSGFLSNVGNSLGYLDTIGPVDLSAASFSGQRAYDLISDCAQQSNKNFYLVKASESVTTGVSTYSLWYAFDYQAAYDSTLRLTNVKADVDNSVTFAVNPDLILRRTPERVYSGVLVRYLGGEVYQQDTTTGNAFRFRDAVHPGINVASSSVASARATRYLADADAEEDRITCRFTVPKQSVNGVRAGQRVQFRFSHLPGYDATAYQYARCVRRAVRQLSDDFYELKVDLIPTPPGNATATAAYLERPNDDEYIINSSGLFRARWDNDGDHPGSGRTAQPLTGLIEYVGALADRTGLRVLGDGLVDINYIADIATTGTGTVTITATIRVNGSTVATSQQITTGGLRAISFTWDFDATDIAVRDGDIIEGWCEQQPPHGNAFVLPAGVGNSAHQLYVTGTLR